MVVFPASLQQDQRKQIGTSLDNIQWGGEIQCKITSFKDLKMILVLLYFGFGSRQLFLDATVCIVHVALPLLPVLALLVKVLVEQSHLVAAHPDLAVQHGHLVLQSVVQFDLGVELVHDLWQNNVSRFVVFPLSTVGEPGGTDPRFRIRKDPHPQLHEVKINENRERGGEGDHAMQTVAND